MGTNYLTAAQASTPERIGVATELDSADLVQYDEHHHKIIRFLQTMQGPTDISVRKDRHFRIEARHTTFSTVFYSEGTPKEECRGR